MVKELKSLTMSRRKMRRDSSKKKPAKKRQSLKKILHINKHNANAKKRRQDKAMDPFQEDFIPKLQQPKEDKKPKTLSQKPSKKMKQVLQMMEMVKKMEQEGPEKHVLKVDEDGKVVLEEKEDLMQDTEQNAEESESDDDADLAALEGRDFNTLTRKQKQKIKRKMQKEKKKMQKLERSLKKMYKKDKYLELDQDFAAKLGEDEVEFGEQVEAPPTKDVFEKKKAKVAKSKAMYMTEDEIKRFNLRQMAILRNQELQVQKAKQLYSEKKKRELQAEYSEFTDW